MQFQRALKSAIFLMSVLLAVVIPRGVSAAESGTAGSDVRDIRDRVRRGEEFLSQLFDSRFDLLPEYKGSRTYWLFHDNYLAAHLLERSRPDLSKRIRSVFTRYGVTNSGKIEIVFAEATNPLPFRRYALTDVAVRDGMTIRTERVTTNIMTGWETYADLRLLASMALAQKSPDDARQQFAKAADMWDGRGFDDPATRHNRVHSTYKLALYLIAADRLNVSVPHRREVIERLFAMQSAEGGWRTDYKNGKPIGYANVETTCLALIALETIDKSFSGQRILNGLVSELLTVDKISGATNRFTFSRANDGWTFISVDSGNAGGNIRLLLDKGTTNQIEILHDAKSGSHFEAMRHLAEGKHEINVECSGNAKVESLRVRSIPELIHCGLGFNPEIKSYGQYDMEFLKKDVLPNITTLMVPGHFKPDPSLVDAWHRQGKHFVGEVGINSQAKTAVDHAGYWSGFYTNSPFLDGIIINEFIVNRPVIEWAAITPERRVRMENESKQYEIYGDAIRWMRADDRFKNKMLYAYFGGSGKKLNQEIIGTNFVRTITDCDFRVVPERYLHEMSSERGSKEALQTFIEGVDDWNSKEPGLRNRMLIAFGLFSMPPGGINKQPDVDYHVWMDQQMNLVANHPTFAHLAGIEWWTSTLADEETVRFVGKLYRHYGIEGRTNFFTHDPLFLSLIQNADFENGTNGWTLKAATEGSIAAKSFPRYGRIEGRYMGLGRPADPEHIGDTFLLMKRSEKEANTFSQTIKNLQRGRLYSMKMFTSDYRDLVEPKARKKEEATPFIGSVKIDGVEIDTRRSFSEMYSSNPEPKIPVWITYHWKVFRAVQSTATLTVSDWPDRAALEHGFGQEQTFNFLEIQPYHE